MPSNKPITKVATVIALAQRKNGTTIDEISKKLKISRVAAGSLIADARGKGVKIKFAEGVYHA
jgi:DNA-binding transcriptional regulator LsrR (DeoR family)